MHMEKPELKKDKYRRVRGGTSKFLNLSCSKCSNFVALYQKDGPGPLKRMYLDRILAPETLTGLQSISLKKIPPFACLECKQVIGIPFLYEKENRPSFRLLDGTVSKKIFKEN